MSKLLNTELHKLHDIIVSMLVITLIYAVIGAFRSMSNRNTIYLGFGELLAIFAILICSVTGVFISQDFENNTVRNKLIIGHTRLKVYFSYQIIFALLALILTAIFIAVYILSGKIFFYMEVFRSEPLDTEAMKVLKENFFKALPVYLTAVPAFTAAAVFIPTALRSVAGGVLTVYLAYTINSLPAFSDFFPNNKFIEYINEILPSSQIFLMEGLSPQPDFSPLKYIAFSLAFAAVLTASGYALFRKADLK